MKFTTELRTAGGSTLSVRRIHAVERVSGLFEVDVMARSADPALDLASMVGKDASLTVQLEEPTGRRAWSGIVERAEQTRAVTGGAGEELSEYSIRIVPTMWLATQRVDHRIFQHLSIPDIVEEVLSLHGVQLQMQIDKAAYPKLELRVQYGETDFAFATRLLEEAGISWAILDGEGSSGVMLGDDLTGKPLRRHVALPFDPTPTVQAPRPRVREVRVSSEVRSTGHVMTDHDFRNPSFQLRGEAKGGKQAGGDGSVHEYAPGGSLVEREAAQETTTPVADDKGIARHDRKFADERAKRTLEAARAGREQAHFESNQIDLSAGSVVAVEEHPHPTLASELLVVETRVELEMPTTLRVFHVGYSAADPYRTPRRTPKPKVSGMQSARVTGPQGEEIHTDEFGRVRVHFPWDREGETDDRSSCWIRVVEGWAGLGFGMIALPRVGQEVVVAFLEGDPDQPIIVGRLFNQLNPVPYKLPANKTVSAWRTNSSPTNGGYNELKFEDMAMKELIFTRAQRDRHALVLRDERTRIERMHHHTTVADQHVVTKANKKELVQAQSHLHVVADTMEKFDAKRSTGVGVDWDVKVGTKLAIESGEEIHLKAGATLIIEAGTRLTLKGPGGFVDIHEGGVDVVGDMVRINSGGEAGTGSGAAPTDPEDAEEAEPMDVSVE